MLLSFVAAWMLFCAAEFRRQIAITDVNREVKRDERTIEYSCQWG
jgi:uncharacterized membrane protein YciS (DUF1049 family)